jgi:acyl carrier protein
MAVESTMPLERALSPDARVKVRAFITSLLGRPIYDAEDIFRSGLVSSLFGIQLLTFIESEFGLKVVDEDLDLMNFSSIENICNFVSRKKTPP